MIKSLSGCTVHIHKPNTRAFCICLFFCLVMIVERRLCCWDAEPLWDESGEGRPRWCWKSLREQSWQSAEQRDWHYWCHNAIVLTCKIQIFSHHADLSDSDPRPRRTNILREASSACTLKCVNAEHSIHTKWPRPRQDDWQSWNTCWGQLHAQNWGHQVLLGCTLAHSLLALWIFLLVTTLSMEIETEVWLQLESLWGKVRRVWFYAQRHIHDMIPETLFPSFLFSRVSLHCFDFLFKKMTAWSRNRKIQSSNS